jgi:hypothetical protein
MTAKTLLRPDALAAAGADVHDLVLMSILVVDGVDVGAVTR